jgi:hypothetical protein
MAVMEQMERKSLTLEKLSGKEGGITQDFCSTQTSKDRAFGILSELKMIYGSKFSTIVRGEQEMNEAINLWGWGLKDVDDKTVKLALSQCVNESKYPPTLNEFKQICDSLKKRESFGNPNNYQNVKSKNDTPIGRIINEGAFICSKLKEIYPEKSWFQIAAVFTRLKTKLRPMHTGMDEVGFLLELKKYSKESLAEAVELI